MIPDPLKNANLAWDWFEDFLGQNVYISEPAYGIWGHGLTNGQRIGVKYPAGGFYAGRSEVVQVEVISATQIRIPTPGPTSFGRRGKLGFFDPDGQSGGIPILAPIGQQANDRQVPSGSLPGTLGGLDPFNTSVLISDLSSRGNEDVNKLVESENRKCWWCWIVIAAIVSWAIWRKMK